METPDANEGSSEQFRELVAALARDAAEILAKNPDAAIVGLIAERGTTECKRVRTLLEQGTGTEYANESFAGVLPAAALPKILASSFPPDALAWMSARGDARELHIVICAQDAVRVAAVKLPDSGQ